MGVPGFFADFVARLVARGQFPAFVPVFLAARKSFLTDRNGRYPLHSTTIPNSATQQSQTCKDTLRPSPWIPGGT